MKRTLKRTLKSYLRPVYSLLPAAWQELLRKRIAKWRPLPPGSVVVPPTVLETLLVYMKESDRILLALLKSPHPAAARLPDAPAFQAVALGNHRVLVGHAATSFMYLDVRDAAVAPHIILDQYEKGVQRALQDLVRPGWVVLEARARQGFHTLTLARLVSPTGRVIAFEPEPLQLDALRDNLAAHNLQSIVQAAAPGGPFFPTQEALSRLERKPDLVRLDVGDQTGLALAEIRDLLHTLPQLRLMLSLPMGALEPQLLSRLSDAGMAFWEIRTDGRLVQSSVKNILSAVEHEPVHLVAARSLI